VNDPAAQAAPLQVVATGLYADYLPGGTIYRQVAEALPDAVEHFGLVVINLQGSGRPEVQRIPEALESVGFKTVYTATVPPPPSTVDNWRPYLESAKSDGVQVFEYRGVPEQAVPVMASFSDVGFKPAAVVGNAALYSGTFIKGNDALADIPVYIDVMMYPFELADDNPPTQQFLDVLDDAVPGWSDNPKALAVDGFSAWLLFAQSAKACGSELTRDCVLEKAAAAGTWDAGGLRAPVEISVGEPKGPECGLVMRATPDGFEYDEEITKPNQGIFHCNESGRIEAPR
jgi:hypothetical protein